MIKRLTPTLTKMGLVSETSGTEMTSTNGGSAEPCWFCDDTVRGDLPPGGWLLDDGEWRAGAAPASYAIPGTVVLEARRHVLDQATFTKLELGTFAEVTGRLLHAIRTATSCDRVYQWATMDAYAHFHIWLVPWWTSCTERGPRYLVSSVFGVTPDEEATHRVATHISQALSGDE